MPVVNTRATPSASITKGKGSVYVGEQQSDQSQGQKQSQKMSLSLSSGSVHREGGDPAPAEDYFRPRLEDVHLDWLSHK